MYPLPTLYKIKMEILLYNPPSLPHVQRPSSSPTSSGPVRTWTPSRLRCRPTRRTGCSRSWRSSGSGSTRGRSARGASADRGPAGSRTTRRDAYGADDLRRGSASADGCWRRREVAAEEEEAAAAAAAAAGMMAAMERPGPPTPRTRLSSARGSWRRLMICSSSCDEVRRSKSILLFYDFSLSLFAEQTAESCALFPTFTSE